MKKRAPSRSPKKLSINGLSEFLNDSKRFSRKLFLGGRVEGGNLLSKKVPFSVKKKGSPRAPHKKLYCKREANHPEKCSNFDLSMGLVKRNGDPHTR